MDARKRAEQFIASQRAAQDQEFAGKERWCGMVPEFASIAEESVRAYNVSAGVKTEADHIAIRFNSRPSRHGSNVVVEQGAEAHFWFDHGERSVLCERLPFRDPDVSTIQRIPIGIEPTPEQFQDTVLEFLAWATNGGGCGRFRQPV